MADLQSPPNADSTVSFTWFTWFRRLFTETLSYFKTDGSRPITGDVTATGTALRFKADFSNATVSDRYSFQTSTTNGATIVQTLPDGSGTTSGIVSFAGSDLTNVTYLGLTGRAAECRIASSKIGSSSTFQPLTFFTSDVKQLEINAAGRATFTNDAYVGSNVIYHAGNLPSGGKLKSQLLTVSDSSPWTWPTGVDAVWVTAIGSGAGGSTRNSTTSGGGGGSGEYCVRYFYPRNGVTTTTFTVGIAALKDANGASTTFGTLVLKGGLTGDRSASTTCYGGKGGGDVQTAPTTRVAGVRSVDEGVCTFSGANGGGGNTGTSAGFAGGGSEMWAGGAGGASGAGYSGGGGGGSSPWGVGGTGGSEASAATQPAATAYGCGGGGGSSSTNATYNAGASGQHGVILLEWIG